MKVLEKYHSIVNLAGSEPLLVKDKAFWVLLKTRTEFFVDKIKSIHIIP